MLEVRDLRVSFRVPGGLLRAVDGVSFIVGEGETLGVVGESGSGKSVMMLAALGLLDNSNAHREGQILYRGRDLLSLTSSELRSLRGNEIAMVFQDPMTSLNPVYPVGWQIVEQIRAHEKVSRYEARQRAIELLTAVGIADPERRVDDRPHQLSGGMRQRVMIAMALSCGPELLIADEPTTALDVTVQAQILDLLARMKEERGLTVILVTHDIGVLADVADDVMVMYAGRILEQGSTAEVLAEPSHPYTDGLLAAAPGLAGPKIRRLTAIQGGPPSLLALPPGCRFAPRCPHRFTRCDEEPLLARRGSATHLAACHLEGAGSGSDNLLLAGSEEP